MKKIFLFGMAAISMFCQAGEPILNKDKFEADYVRCIESGFAKSCWASTLSGHFVPWAKHDAELLASSEEGYTKWLDGQPMYKVHPGIKEVKGEVFDNRSYLLERDDGNVVGLWISYRQVKGKWYLGEIIGVSSDEFVRAILNMTDPQKK